MTADFSEALFIQDDRQRVATAIDGLGFVSNYLIEHRSYEIHPETKVISNPGSIVGHFVTHGAGFRYSTFGVHVGQMDRLTFYCGIPKYLVGYFVDCRQDSPSRGCRLSIKFKTSAWRKLVIPCGVAHTFENLECVVTRNDLTLFADVANTSWNLLNDDLVFAWSVDGIAGAPVVTVNTAEIPLSAATLFYGLQRQLLRGGQQQSSSEVEVNIAGKQTRLIASSVHDQSAAVNLPHVNNAPVGCEFALNSFNSVSEASWSVIPTTPSCVADWVILDVGANERVWFS